MNKLLETIADIIMIIFVIALIIVLLPIWLPFEIFGNLKMEKELEKIRKKEEK